VVRVLRFGYTREKREIMSEVREVTNRLIEAIDDGEVTATHVVCMALAYLSEAEVRDMLRVNDYGPFVGILGGANA